MAQKFAFVNGQVDTGKTTTMVNLAGVIHHLFVQQKGNHYMENKVAFCKLVA